MAKRFMPPPAAEPRTFRSVGEIERGIVLLRRRVQELESFDVADAVRKDSAKASVLTSSARETIREVFGQNSPEFQEHQYLDMWSGPTYAGMSDGEFFDGVERGRQKLITIVEGLIARLEEKRGDLESGGLPFSPSISGLRLHPRIESVVRPRLVGGQHWDAVFAASKALVYLVRERADRHDLDGVDLMRKVFSRKEPVLAFNDLSDQTDLDEQEGMMHLFEGAMLGIRNVGAHSFPEGSEQRALEYIVFLSLLAYRVEESHLREPTS